MTKEDFESFTPPRACGGVDGLLGRAYMFDDFSTKEDRGVLGRPRAIVTFGPDATCLHMLADE